MTYADTEDLSDYPDEREAETEEERKKREEEERAAEAAAAARAESAAQARALSAQMAVEEARVAQPPPVLAQPTVSPISQGRMYMGPNVPDAALSQLVKPGEAVSYYAPDVRPPPLSEDEWRQSELQRLQAADIPGRSRTIAISPPEAMPVEESPPVQTGDRFAAYQAFAADRAAGMPVADLLAKHGPAMFKGLAPSAQSRIVGATLGPEPGRAATATAPRMGDYDRALLASDLKRRSELYRDYNNAQTTDEKNSILTQLFKVERSIKERNPQVGQATLTPPVTQAGTTQGGSLPERRAEAANALKRQHPEWTKARIIAEANRQVPR